MIRKKCHLATLPIKSNALIYVSCTLSTTNETKQIETVDRQAGINRASMNEIFMQILPFLVFIYFNENEEEPN